MNMRTKLNSLLQCNLLKDKRLSKKVGTDEIESFSLQRETGRTFVPTLQIASYEDGKVRKIP